MYIYIYIEREREIDLLISQALEGAQAAGLDAAELRLWAFGLGKSGCCAALEVGNAGKKCGIDTITNGLVILGIKAI